MDAERYAKNLKADRAAACEEKKLQVAGWEKKLEAARRRKTRIEAEAGTTVRGWRHWEVESEIGRLERKIRRGKLDIETFAHEENIEDPTAEEIMKTIEYAIRRAKLKKPRARKLNAWVSLPYFDTWRLEYGGGGYTVTIDKTPVRIYPATGLEVDEVIVGGADRRRINNLRLPLKGMDTSDHSLDIYTQLRNEGVSRAEASRVVSEAVGM